jgi:hypothetical protein
MKYFLAITCLVAATVAQTPPAPPPPTPEDCENCLTGVGILFDHWTGHSIDQIINVLDNDVCKQGEHPAACVETMNTWWPVSAKIIYNPKAAPMVCEIISHGECKPEKAEPTCEDCSRFVSAVGHTYATEDAVKKIMEVLEGEAFCLSEELNLDEEALQMCFRNVKHLIPLAMPAIDHAVHEHTHHICRDWFHGLCKDDDKPPPPSMF